MMRDIDALLRLDYADMDNDEVDAIIKYKANLMIMNEKARLTDELTALKDAIWAENASSRLAIAMDEFENVLNSETDFTIPSFFEGGE